MDLCEFKTSLVYRVSSKTARATQRNPISKKNENKYKKEMSEPTMEHVSVRQKCKLDNNRLREVSQTQDRQSWFTRPLE